MLKFIKLAARNVFRNKRRTLISLLVMIFGACALVLAGGYMLFSFWGLRERTIHLETGHLQIYHKDYFHREEDKSLELGLDSLQTIRAIAAANREVNLITPRIDFSGLISNGDKSVVFLGQGLDPEREAQMIDDFGRPESIMTLSNGTEDEVVLGAGLAKSLNVKTGDYLTLMSTTADGALNALDILVKGTFSTGISDIDKRFLKVRNETAQRLMNTARVRALVLLLNRTEMTEPVRQDLQAQYDQAGLPVVVKTWLEMAPYYRSVVGIYNAIFGFLVLVIFVIVLASTANTIIMSISERVQEIGTLMAIGTSRSKLVQLFLYEGLVLGLLGAVIGLLVASGLSWWINHANIMMPPPPGWEEGYRLQIRIEAWLVVAIFMLILTTAVISTLLPAIRATRMKIVDALGHV
ncbi:MAG: FtsX-like permease family protein [candidate division KSB1 bacterium]|nr:FtsX-like permease family protein [candidate division KSB1 bacterium]MDZ7301913.1 FtsX-like permease family protein [candidate division KSB1 bacterium]MDZ7314256.1 FtsX-like permease family protein [candidate division KSB1 bacterium]